MLRPTLRRRCGGGGGRGRGRHGWRWCQDGKDLINAGIEQLALMDKDTRGTSVVINDVAELLREAGKLEEAKKLFTEALEVRRRVLGMDGRTLTSINNLALLLREEKAALGGAAAARGNGAHEARDAGRHEPRDAHLDQQSGGVPQGAQADAGGGSVVPRVPRIEAARARRPPRRSPRSTTSRRCCRSTRLA